MVAPSIAVTMAQIQAILVDGGWSVVEFMAQERRCRVLYATKSTSARWFFLSVCPSSFQPHAERTRFQVYYIAPELRLSSEKIPDNAEIREIHAEKTFPDDAAASAFWTETSRRIEAKLGSGKRCFADRSVKTVPSRASVWPIDVHGSVTVRQRFQQSIDRTELPATVWISISADQSLRAIQGLQPVDAGRCE
jgi:hypothetical protein